MTSIKNRLPVNLEDLIHHRVIENDRVEFKSTWDEHIKQNAIRTVCAFANDFLNNNGGYIILGIEEHDAKPVLPPRGLDKLNVDKIQREIIWVCKGGISPQYLPHIYIEEYQGKTILVIWCPAGENRPYEAPLKKGGGKTYWIRPAGITIEATGDVRRQLLEQAAKIPFDDRRSLEGRIEDISLSLVNRFLQDIRSHLASMQFSPDEIYESLRLVVRLNDHKVPRNVALLFFNEDPERFFRGTRIEVVQFGDDAGGDLIEEKIFRGTLPDQIRSCLNYLNGLGGSYLKKISGQSEVERTVPYPYEAMEEAIVNAVYHCSYEGLPEPVKVYLYPDRMEIISYPGPVPGIKLEHFRSGGMPAVPARNRRIGELLKDLKLAEMRGTGIPLIHRKMKENGSPEATFDFNDERTYFRVILPVHPHYQIVHAIREAGHLWAIGSKDDAISHLERAINNQPGSGILVRQLIEYSFGRDKLEPAQRALEQFEKQRITIDTSLPYLTMAKLLLDQKLDREANEVLKRMPPVQKIDDTVEAAILKKRTNDFEGAHSLFVKAHSLNPDDPKILHEFAQTKIKLAKKIYVRKGDKKNIQTKKRLHQEAAELLRKALQLTDDPRRQAWCWVDLARTLDWLRAPGSEVEAAFLRAIELRPDEWPFKDAYERWQNKAKR